VKVRAVDPLLVEVSGKSVVVSSPRAQKKLRVRPEVLALLTASDVVEVPDDGDAGVLAGAIRQLVELGFLVDADAVPSPCEPWDAWGPMAWQFHVHTRDVPFVQPGTRAADEYFDQVHRRPRPSSVKWVDEDRVLLLPRVRVPMRASFQEVLEGRRTHRDFEDTCVDLDTFATVLHYSFGPLRFADAGDLGTLQLKASASAGARHETEAYVLVFNVADVRPGLYRYDTLRHGLILVNDRVTREDAEHLTYGQGFFTTAAFGVLTAAVAPRMAWKYPHARAYKMLLHNVGHLAQVFSMTATAMHLGAAMTGAIRDTAADALLGLATPAEFTTFALSCGVPIRRADGLPAAIRLPSTAPDYY
jgi:SagB-type dehydrogenase family enzyme